jgi:ABC-type transport system substrate-binding protein
MAILILHVIFTAMNWLKFKLLPFLFLVLACVSCFTTQRNDGKSVFRYNESNAITSLDPAFASDLENMWAVNQIYDGLVTLDDSLHVVPSLAKSWDISPDQLTYTFHLRSNVFFHPWQENTDPSRMTAADVVYSLQRLLSSELASPGKWILSALRDKKNIRALNDSTVQLVLVEPQSTFIQLLTTQYANVVSKAAAEFWKTDFRFHPVGTGPFLFAFWEDQIALVLHKNPAYWMRDEEGKSLPYLDAVQVDFVKDPFTEFQGLVTGVYDFISGLHPSYIDEILGAEGLMEPAYAGNFQLYKVPFIKTDYLGFFLEDQSEIGPWIRDLRFRQALSLSIPRELLCRDLRKSIVLPALQGFVPPVLDQDTAKLSSLSYRPERAKTLMQELIREKGAQPKLSITTTPDYADLMEFIQHEWEKVGIQVQVQVLQGAAFKTASAQGKLAFFRKSWLADFPDAENFLSVFESHNFSPSGPNYTHFSDPQLDAALNTCKALPMSPSRSAMQAQVDQSITENLPLIPLYYDQVIHLVNRRIENWHIDPVNMLDLTRVKKRNIVP